MNVGARWEALGARAFLRLGLPVPLFYDPAYDLACHIRAHAGELIDRWNLQELSAEKNYVSHRIVFRNETSVIEFWYDVRDSYLTARYGPVSLIGGKETVGWPEVDSLGSIDRLLLQADLPQIPVGPRPRREQFAQDVGYMIRMVERFEGTIFGATWDHEGD